MPEFVEWMMALPEGWTDIQAYYAVTTPGYVIEEGAAHVRGRSFNYAQTPPP